MPHVEAIVHNSPALDSLKHQQLRSLCARHGLKSTGKKDHLIKRLKALRDNEYAHHESLEQEPLDGSFDIVDDQDAEEAQHGDYNSLPGSFEAATRPSSRASTDEFGALSADAQTITRSSSWKDKLASVFGGGGGLSTSNSSDSLSSIRTARGGAGAPSSLSRANKDFLSQGTSSSSSSAQKHNDSRQNHSAQQPSTSSSRPTLLSPPAVIRPTPPTPATAAFRIVEDSFIAGNSTYPDCSFVPRTSFEGDSIDLTNVPVWPPPPGVILISPRQSPNKPTHPTTSNTVGRKPMSAQKRYLEDVDEDENGYDDDDGQEEGRYGSIRMIPRLPLDSALTPGRRIAALPKRMSIIASSPPKFDLEAPPLPSFATVAEQAIRLDSRGEDEEEGNSSSATVRMEMEEITKPPSDNVEMDHAQPQQPFVFGSPRQQPLTDDSFLKKIDGFAIAKQLEELQRRTGAVSQSSIQKGFMPRTASNGNLQSKNGVRFEGKHQKEFKMMDSIANHYAARRKVCDNAMKSHSQTPNKRTRIESADAVSALSTATTANNLKSQTNQGPSVVHRQASCPALSLTTSTNLNLNQQGRYAPNIPPRPKMAKTAAQQAEDRDRIRQMQKCGSGASSSLASGNGIQRRAGRASMSPRKAGANPSTRKLPPLPSSSSSGNSLTSNSSSSSAASRMFKSTFTSLKSFGSSSSLSSKATLGGMTASTSSRSISGQSQQVSDFGTLQPKTPAIASGSVSRPTIASLARQQSRQNLDSLTSPRQVLSPRSITTSDSKNNLVSPRSAVPHTTLEKKKVSSMTAAHRSSPMKGNLDDSIAQARRIRAKKLGSQMQTGQMRTARAASTAIPSISRSPSKNAELGAGSVSSRPAWR